MSSGRNKSRINLLFLTIICLLLGGAFLLHLYKGRATALEFDYSMRLNEKDNTETINQKLKSDCGLKYPVLFKAVAAKMNLDKWIKKGRYTLKPDMTMLELVRLFREGKGKTVNLTIKGLGGLESLSGICGHKLEGDSADFMKQLKDSVFLNTLGFNYQTVYALPLPDTYNIYWHTEPDELLIKLKVEYDKYWTSERKHKAAIAGLSPLQVSTLASIVSKETNQSAEMPMVAGMYLNRLRIGMPLQADPTIKFALNEPGLKRIYNIHLNINSPYNTYLNKGLPPGPICIPSKQAIEAVLNYSPHTYLFMCAKEDFSGYHNFATSYTEHLKNAKKYQLALDRNGIE